MSEPRWNEAGTREPPRQPPRPAAGAWPTSPRRAAGPRGEPGRERPPDNGASPRWGQLPWGRGIVLIVMAAVVGVLLTIVTGSDPGFLLGVLVVVGAVAASLAVDARRAYLIIPAPALAYLAAAILAGLIHDRAADSSHTLLAVNAARWVGSGFLGMVTATAVAGVITVARWLRSSRGFGQSPVGPQPPAHDSRRSPGADRAAPPPNRRD